MAEQRENRRVRMTKRMMKEALLELLEQRELVNISVTAICEAADVHRSTFYKYYRDQADLLRDLEQDYLDRVPLPERDPRQWDEEGLLAETTEFFEYVKRNERAFRILLGEATSSDFAARLIDLLSSKYAQPSEGDTTSHYASLYVANGTVGMLREWVNSGFPVSSREVAEMMYLFSVKVSPLKTESFSGTYRLAGVIVRVESLHEDVHALCQEYRCEGVPDFVVRTSQSDIDFERERSESADAATRRAARNASDGYLETLAVYRKVAEVMPARGIVLMHGSCVAVDGAAYIFCAPSGTGKSTHVRLWRELLGPRAMMVNDDKPLVRISDGKAIVYGTPWDGKHRLSSDVAVPLRAVCILGRAEKNEIEQVSTDEAYPALLRHVYRPLDPEALALTLGLVDQLATCVDLWRLRCNMDIEAAELSFSAMSGGEF